MQGVISAHPRGFGFVAQDNGEEHFVSPPQMRSLVPGDKVVFSLVTHPRTHRLSAVVGEVLERPESFWLGQLESSEHGTLLRPDDPLHAPVTVAVPAPVDPADVVQVRIAPGAGLAQPRVPAELVAHLGPRNDRDFDVRYAIAKWRLPVEFSEEALAQARGFAQPSLDEAAAMGFADMTALPFVTIDGENTRDFDDALCLVDQGTDRLLHVAIAHVSQYVRAGSALDAQALERATSVYLPDRTLPMLPPELSNGLCSLQPGVPRYALVCSLKYSKQGQLEGYAFSQAVIRSAARLTYRQVAGHAVPASVAGMIQDLWRWFDAQGAARERRGLQGRDHPEPRLELRPDGSYAVQWEPPLTSNALIEEAMLAANRAAAAHLALLGAGMLFRHQEGPDEEKWEETRDWLLSRGIVAPALPTLADLNRLLTEVRGLPEQPQLEHRVRRAMSPAVYHEAESSHYSLGLRAYTHFTSPIRRYADLLVHRMLLGEATQADAALSEHLSARSRAARQASRYPWERLKRRFVWRSGEREHDAQVISESARGFKAVLDRWQVLAVVDAGELESHGWAWDEAAEVWLHGKQGVELGSTLKLRLTALKDEGPVCELHAQPVG